MTKDLEARLTGTRWGHVTLDFFTNSAHFPIANLFLELLDEGPRLLLKPDIYAMIAATAVQAFYLGSREYIGKPRPLVGNMIGPAIYTISELLIEGVVFFQSPNHVAYLGFAAVIGSLQQLQLALPGRGRNALLITEHLCRTMILLVMYWIFEAADDPRYATAAGFLSDKSHIFILLSLTFIGIMLGQANSLAKSYLTILRETARELRTYSEWFLGKNILSMAVADPNALSIQRRERTMVFIDIRGFTAWSEMQPPERVVDMLNGYFGLVESIWKSNKAIKVKFTGDEIMLVFAAPEDALQSAFGINAVGSAYLKSFGLSAGASIHTGILVEGMIGSAEVKGYDVIGDTVNITKRICDNASGGEVLVSESTKRMLQGRAVFSEPRQIAAKGKAEPLTVYAVTEEKQPVVDNFPP